MINWKIRNFKETHNFLSKMHYITIWTNYLFFLVWILIENLLFIDFIMPIIISLLHNICTYLICKFNYCYKTNFNRWLIHVHNILFYYIHFLFLFICIFPLYCNVHFICQALATEENMNAFLQFPTEIQKTFSLLEEVYKIQVYLMELSCWFILKARINIFNSIYNM